jgi:hypothetical protein
MARSKGNFIKDLTFDKFYVIVFKFRDLTYVYCKPNDNYTFKPLEILHVDDLEKINIQKYTSEVYANSVMKKIPMHDIDGMDVYLEVKSNTYLAEML